MSALPLSSYVLYGLVPLDVILYIILIEGYLRQRRMFRVPNVSGADEAFAFFEASYKQTFPEDEDGFTWREAVAKAARMVELKDVEWDKVQGSLREYEAYRYDAAGKTRKNGAEIDSFPILKLALRLRERTFSITKWERWRKHQ